MNVAEQIVAQLVDAGVHRIYGIVGDSLNPIVDAVRKTGGSRKGGIDWIHVRHEEAAAFAASADAANAAASSWLTWIQSMPPFFEPPVLRTASTIGLSESPTMP